MNWKKILIVLFLSTTGHGIISAQNEGPAVGEWKSMFCYYGTTSAAYGSNKIYCGTTSGFFIYDLEDEMTAGFSKVSGMADVDISHVAYDPQSGKVILAYTNSNLDIFDNGNFSNIPDIKVSTIPGDKTINHMLAYDKRAYLSTPLGLIVANLEKAEISFTTTFFQGSSKASVYSTAIRGDHIYAATSNGIFRIALSTELMQDYTKWEKYSEHIYHQIVADNDDFYGLVHQDAADSVYRINADGSSTLFYTSGKKISTIDLGRESGIWIGEEYSGVSGTVTFHASSGETGEAYTAFFPNDIIETATGKVFFADNDLTRQFGGLRESALAGATIGHAPAGPESPYSFDIWAYNGEVWVAHGGYDVYYAFTGNTKGFSAYRKNEWKNFGPQISAMGLSFLSDASTIFKDRKSKKVYVGMAIGGMIEVNENDELTLFRDTFFGTYGSAYIVSGIAQDKEGNMWFSNFGADQDIRVKTEEGEWHAFHPTASSSRLNAFITIDDDGNKWSVLYSGGGVVIFNDNNTFDDPSDDKSRVLRTGTNNGNLPSAVVLSLAKDHDNYMWIGTNDGIGIVESPTEALNGNADATIKTVSYDGENAGKLFKGKSVTAIAVDGNNNKWIGTSNLGVWLISDDANELYHYFHTNNSPLPSNEIKSIDIDPVTGDVYFSTAKGIVVYRGNATQSSPDPEAEIVTYPNPVPSGYEGMIAIKGLSGRSEVRITDIAGQLVAQFSTEGGQAVWNGKDYTGRRPQTGVYLVIVTDQTTGKTTKSGKIIFNE